MEMINFACKQVPIEQVIRCAFAMSKTDYQVFKTLLSNNKELEISQIAKKLKRDRSTTQKSIKNLLDKKIISRRQINIGSGGYLFVYEISDKNNIKKLIYENFEAWQKKVLAELEKW
ncbi:MarR family transcriptional regulator [Candidatus Woesearchaeota archaeon]|nr:MarR family transcriptional regulator [Candidatus Woesearchaeota archaeon]